MIAILGKKDLDVSTEDVIDWLEYYNAKYLRINGSDFSREIKFNSYSFSFKDLPISEIKSCWFRRWIDDDHYPNIFEGSNLSQVTLMKLLEHVKGEMSMVDKLLFGKLAAKNWLSHPKEINHSKISVLEKANEAGIKIPETIITTCKKELLDFKKKHHRIITKCIKDSPAFWIQDEEFITLKTEELHEDVINKLPETFFPSLFQQLIEKDYELRVFYLNRKFYSMAIFSQLDQRTQIDFRHYNWQTPNRTVPYKINNQMEEKLQKLMDSLEMTTGSVDLIKAKNGDYILLEINPVGQFGMTSRPCNYYLEKEIAKYLIDNDR